MHIRRTAATQQRLDLYHTGHAIFFFRDYEELRRVGMTDACAFELFVLSTLFGEVSVWIFFHFLSECGLHAVNRRLQYHFDERQNKHSQYCIDGKSATTNEISRRKL